MNITSPSFPKGAQCDRTEQEVRELGRAKFRAKAEWEAFFKSTHGKLLSEDEMIDREIESMRLLRAFSDADYALFCATKVSP